MTMAQQVAAGLQAREMASGRWWLLNELAALLTHTDEKRITGIADLQRGITTQPDKDATKGDPMTMAQEEKRITGITDLQRGITTQPDREALRNLIWPDPRNNLLQITFSSVEAAEAFVDRILAWATSTPPDQADRKALENLLLTHPINCGITAKEQAHICVTDRDKGVHPRLLDDLIAWKRHPMPLRKKALDELLEGYEVAANQHACPTPGNCCCMSSLSNERMKLADAIWACIHGRREATKAWCSHITWVNERWRWAIPGASAETLYIEDKLVWDICPVEGCHAPRPKTP